MLLPDARDRFLAQTASWLNTLKAVPTAAMSDERHHKYEKGECLCTKTGATHYHITITVSILYINHYDIINNTREKQNRWVNNKNTNINKYRITKHLIFKIIFKINMF